MSTWSETQIVGFLMPRLNYNVHYENMPMQYADIFKLLKIEHFIRKKLMFFLIFAQNIDCGYTLEPPRLASPWWNEENRPRRGGSGEEVLTTTHNACFGSKIRKLGIYLQTPIFLYQSGV